MTIPAGGVTLPEVKAAIDAYDAANSAADALGKTGRDEPMAEWLKVDQAIADAKRAVFQSCLAYCRAALAGEWRDIASAPMNQSILVASKGLVFIAHKVYEVKWTTPTHWMPLPAAPLPKEPGHD